MSVSVSTTSITALRSVVVSFVSFHFPFNRVVITRFPAKPEVFGSAIKLNRSLSGVEAIFLASAPLSQRFTGRLGFANPSVTFMQYSHYTARFNLF